MTNVEDVQSTQPAAGDKDALATAANRRRTGSIKVVFDPAAGSLMQSSYQRCAPRVERLPPQGARLAAGRFRRPPGAVALGECGLRGPLRGQGRRVVDRGVDVRGGPLAGGRDFLGQARRGQQADDEAGDEGLHVGEVSPHSAVA